MKQALLIAHHIFPSFTLSKDLFLKVYESDETPEMLMYTFVAWYLNQCVTNYVYLKQHEAYKTIR